MVLSQPSILLLVFANLMILQCCVSFENTLHVSKKLNRNGYLCSYKRNKPDTEFEFSTTRNQEKLIAPKLIVFDLDYTMWNPEMYQLAGSPFRSKNGAVFDRSGTRIDLFPDVRNILKRIATSEEFGNTEIGAASRTEYPSWALECMNLIDVYDGIKMKDLFTYTEIYPGTKTRHFKNLQKDSKCSFDEMLFFDDYSSNCRDVASLGVTAYTCPNGLSEREFDEGIEKFSRNHS